MAAQNQQNVPSMPSNLASNNTKIATQDQNSQKVAEMKPADIQAEKPSSDEVKVAEVFMVVSPATPTAPGLVLRAGNLQTR